MQDDLKKTEQCRLREVLMRLSTNRLRLQRRRNRSYHPMAQRLRLLSAFLSCFSNGDEALLCASDAQQAGPRKRSE